MLKIKVSNVITIENGDARLVSALTKALTIPNPMYHKLMRMKGFVPRAHFGVRKEYVYYHLKDGNIHIPRGYRRRLISWLNAMNYEYELEEDLIEIKL